jgi:hypothetical protein
VCACLWTRQTNGGTQDTTNTQRFCGACLIIIVLIIIIILYYQYSASLTRARVRWQCIRESRFVRPLRCMPCVHILCVHALAQAQADAKAATIKLRQDTHGGRHLPVEGPGAGRAAVMVARNTLGSGRGQMAALLLCVSLTHSSFDVHFRGEEIKPKTISSQKQKSGLGKSKGDVLHHPWHGPRP